MSASRQFRKADQYVDKYGGKIDDYVKKSSDYNSYRASDTIKIETHWVENAITGDRYDFKVKIQKVGSGVD